MKRDIIFSIFSLIITTLSLLLTWLAMLIFLSYRTAQGIDPSDTGMAYTTGLFAFGYSFFLAPIGLIPAYFISMKLAQWLREKYGWPLRRRRRLFLLALAIPIILLILSSTLLGQS